MEKLPPVFGRSVNPPVLGTFPRRKCLSVAAALGLCLLPLLSQSTHAQNTVFSDDFSTSASGALDNFYRVGASSLTVFTNDTGSLSGNALRWGPGAKMAVLANFGSVTLTNPGDYIMASYDILFTSAPGMLNTGPSLALYNSNGTVLTEEYTGAADDAMPATLTDDLGYKVYKSFNTTGDFTLFENSAGFAPMRFASGSRNASLETTDSGSGIVLDTVYSVSLRIELAANSTDLDVTYSFGGLTETYSISGIDVLTKTFNEIGINPAAGDQGGTSFIDNVLITTNTTNIPEPSSYALLLGGAPLLIVGWRPPSGSLPPLGAVSRASSGLFSESPRFLPGR